MFSWRSVHPEVFTEIIWQSSLRQDNPVAFAGKGAYQARLACQRHRPVRGSFHERPLGKSSNSSGGFPAYASGSCKRLRKKGLQVPFPLLRKSAACIRHTGLLSFPSQSRILSWLASSRSLQIALNLLSASPGPTKP